MRLAHALTLAGLLAAHGKSAFGDSRQSTLAGIGAIVAPPSISEEFTTLTHSAFPKHAVRIARAHNFCDPSVRTYSGYVDIEVRHLFFYFFESRSNPETDDVVMWINGGPGASGAIGMLMELGPCTIASPNSTTFNKYSWNNRANLLVLDQPVGVGFSYAEHGETVTTTEDAALDVAAFFAILSDTFPQYQGRALHLAGESYGGRYIPLLASAIVDQNTDLVKRNVAPINLASVMIGNGASERYHTMASYVTMQCTNASGMAPIQTISACVRMKQALPRCQKMIRQNCEDSWDQMNCEASLGFCYNEILSPWDATGRSLYDMSSTCYGNVKDTICYAETLDIIAFLNAPETRRTLHTDSLPTIYRLVNFDLNADFGRSGDELRSSTGHLGALLDRGVRVLLYAGTYDLICNWVGNEAMSRSLEWAGQDSFAGSELREWDVDGEAAGKVRSWAGLTFASVYEASHMVPYDKPVQALAMLDRWLSAKPL